MKLTVVSPTYNEAENVGALISQIHEALAGVEHEIIVVDDNSPDYTWKRVEAVAARDPHVRLVRRRTNRGLTPSVLQGFSLARGEYVACIDADLQHDPKTLPAMLRELEDGADLVVGSRYSTGSGTSNWSKIRRMQSAIATKLCQIVLGAGLRDPLSGYFMLRRSDFALVRSQVAGNGFKVLLEIAAKMRPRKVVEVPIAFRPRKHGESKLSTRVVLQYMEQLYSLSKAGRHLSVRFTKFAIVGTTGMVVNLVALAAIIHALGIKDWRASLMASLLATVSNYLLNNSWTFRERTRKGRHFISGYVMYLGVSLIGISLTAGLYHVLTHTAAKLLEVGLPAMRSELLLLCQLLAVSAGIYSNYHLNKYGTWGTTREPMEVEAQGLFELTTKQD
jgi:dolichol-phosphate mannosyltransferase